MYRKYIMLVKSSSGNNSTFDKGDDNEEFIDFDSYRGLLQ